VYVYSGMQQLASRHAPHERDQDRGIERLALRAEHAAADGAGIEPDAVTDRHEGVRPDLLIARKPTSHLFSDRRVGRVAVQLVEGVNEDRLA
jgi:hypothetical protein